VAVGQTLTIEEPQAMGVDHDTIGGFAGLRVTPNPSTGDVWIQAAPGVVPSSGYGVFDAGGRLVCLLPKSFGGDGARGMKWDGRSESGSFVTSGVYWVHAIGGASPIAVKMVRVE
jgi:hypothetical protein